MRKASGKRLKTKRNVATFAVATESNPQATHSQPKKARAFLSRCLKWKMIITWFHRCRWCRRCCSLISIYESRMNGDNNQQNGKTIQWQIVELHCCSFLLFRCTSRKNCFWQEEGESKQKTLLYSRTSIAKFHMQITICLISRSWTLYCLCSW